MLAKTADRDGDLTRVCLIVSILTLVVVSPLAARLFEGWSYRRMFDRADLIAIARPVATEDTNEHSLLQEFNPPYKVVGVNSDFETLLVLKGPKDIKKIRLHHYRTADDQSLVMDGPGLLKIRPDDHPTFLLFLIRERDGRYAPLSGQTDPALMSIVQLKSAAD
jgi:hypothetical protein